MYAGVDEAGRGPVIGPLVVAGVAGRDGQAPDGIGDSKQLSPRRRGELADAIQASSLEVAVREITADELNDRMQDGEDLNTIETEAFATVLAELDAERAVVDQIGTEDAALEQALETDDEGASTVEARAGADASNVLVGAASIVAKVRRDQAVDEIADELGADVGSGYPSDPTTRSFLEDWRETSIDPPPYARTAWSTLDEIGFGQTRLTEVSSGKTAPTSGDSTP